MTTDFWKGWKAGKMLKGHSYNAPYPILIDDFHGDQTEFLKGMRIAGCWAKVEFQCEPTC